MGNACKVLLVAALAVTILRAGNGAAEEQPYTMNGLPFTAYATQINDPDETKQSLALMVFRSLGEHIKRQRESNQKAGREQAPLAEVELEKYCKAHPEFFKALIELLESEKPHMRVEAAWALTCRGANGAEAVSKLLAHINDEKELPFVRDAAASALNRIKPDKDATQKLLMSLLNSADERARYQGLEMAGRLGADAQPAAGRIIELIRDKDQNVHLSAMSNLGRIKHDPKVVVPILVKELQGLDGTMFAADGLGNMGPAAAEAVPALIRALSYADENTRSNAAQALGQIKSNAQAAVPALILAMKDERVDVRRSAAFALGEFGPAAAAAVPVLNHAFLHDPAGMSVTQYAHEALKKIGPVSVENTKVIDPPKEVEAAWQGRTLQQWAELFKNVPEENREWDSRAAVALTHFGDAGYQLLGSALLAGGKRHGVALEALASQEGNTEFALRELVGGLSSKDEVTRRFVAQSFGGFGAKAKPAVSALINALKNDEDIPVRFWAAQSLGKIGPDAKDAVPFLVEALNHDEKNLRSYALSALGGIGPEAKAAVPALLEKFKVWDEFDKCHIPSVLGKIGAASPEVLPFLVNALKTERGHNTRAFAAAGLGHMGADAVSAVPELKDALEKAQEDHVRGYAAEALGRIGPGASQAVPALLKAVEVIANDIEARDKVFHALTAIDPEAKIILAGLEKLLSSPNVYIRIQTAETAGRLGKRALPLVNSLKKTLANPKEGEGESTVRLLAVQALKKMGNTPEVMAALQAALADKDSTVKRVAQEALNELAR